MIRAAVEFFGSSAKWNKLFVLLRERWMILRSRLSMLSGRDKVDSIEQDGVQIGDAHSRIDEHEWHYESHLNMPSSVIDDVAPRFRQDTRQSDGSVRADYHYRCATFREATFYSNGVSHVSVFDQSDRRVEEFSYTKYSRGIPSCRQIPVSRRLEGTTLSLYGNVENTAGNIGHWMIDGVSRLFLALEHHDLADVDWFLVPGLRYGFQKESLLALGVEESRILEVDVLDCVRCERLLVTNAPRGYSSSITPGWLIDGYRHALLPSGVELKPGKRVYISRRDAGSRKFVNEDQIIECLARFGFEAVQMSEHDFRGKINLFADAEMVVGLTGAGLTNMMLCHERASVLELFPASYVTYFYTSMASHLGLDYHALTFDNHSALSRMNRYYGNLSLDTDRLGRAVETILDGREAV